MPTPLTIFGRTYSDLSEFPAGVLLAPSPRVAEITPGTALPHGACRSILVGVAGTINYTDLYGVAHVGVPAQLGYNPLMAQSVEAGGTASGLWAMY